METVEEHAPTPDHEEDIVDKPITAETTTTDDGDHLESSDAPLSDLATNETSSPPSDLATNETSALDKSDEVDTTTGNITEDADTNRPSDTTSNALEDEGNEVSGEEPRSRVDQLETINQKRKEEKEVFQRLIDDVTRLESELSSKKSAHGQLQMQLDVCLIELDSEKEKSEDNNDKVRELERQLAEAEAKLAAVASRHRANEDRASERDRSEEGSSAPRRLSTIETQNGEGDNPHSEEEVRDLHQKIRRITEDDEFKSQRVAQLEAEAAERDQLLNRLEDEVGKDKMMSLRQHRNGVNSHGSRQGDRRREVRGNEVNPDAQQSAVCIIL